MEGELSESYRYDYSTASVPIEAVRLSDYYQDLYPARAELAAERLNRSFFGRVMGIMIPPIWHHADLWPTVPHGRPMRTYWRAYMDHLFGWGWGMLGCWDGARTRRTS